MKKRNQMLDLARMIFCLAVVSNHWNSMVNGAESVYITTRYGYWGKLSLAIYLADSPARALTVHLLPDAGRDARILPSLLILVCFSTIIMVFGNIIAEKIKTGAERIRAKCLCEGASQLKVGEQRS